MAYFKKQNNLFGAFHIRLIKMEVSLADSSKHNIICFTSQAERGLKGKNCSHSMECYETTAMCTNPRWTGYAYAAGEHVSRAFVSAPQQRHG